jgi:hypothetical protein
MAIDRGVGPRADFLRELDRLIKPGRIKSPLLTAEEWDRHAKELMARKPAQVVEFPPKLVEADRERQKAVAEQDQWKRSYFLQRCEETWQANLDRWAEESRPQGCHKGPSDPDWRR